MAYVVYCAKVRSKVVHVRVSFEIVSRHNIPDV